MIVDDIAILIRQNHLNNVNDDSKEQQKKKKLKMMTINNPFIDYFLSKLSDETS